MTSISSKVIFGIGVALAVAAISSIFVTMVAAQNQNPNTQSGQQASSQGGSSSAGSGAQQQTSTSSTGGQQSQGGGGSSTVTIPQGAASQQTQQFYQPDPAQVSAGSQVTWQNKDSAPHTATADDGSFDTGNIQPGQSGSAKVQGQGQVSYHCTIHPFMKGTLQVSTGSSSSSSQQGNGSSQQQTNSQQPSASGSAGQSQQSSQQNQQPAQQQQGIQASSTPQSSSGQSPGNVVQSLQQAGQALIQAGNVLQQASGGSSNGTSTASQQQSGSTSSGQSQGNNNNSQQSPQGTNPQSQSSQQPQSSSSQQQSLSQQPSAQQGLSAQSGQSQQSGAGNTSQQQNGGSQQQTSAQQPEGAGQQSQPSQQGQTAGQQGHQPSQGGQQQGGQAKQTQPASQQQSSGGGQQSQQSGGMTNQIDIPQGAQSGQNGYYSPANAQVTPGSQVTWNNKDSVAHTATAQDGSFDTGNIPPGSSGSATIQGQGQIQYYCTIHPWMTGTLTVGSSGGQGGAQQAAQQGGGGAAPAAGGQQPQQQQGGAAGQQPSQGGGAEQQQGGSGGAQTSAEGFPIRTQATAFKVLPKSTSTDTGLEAKHKDDWINPNHDIHYTRSSQQTTIGKDNVDKLQVKWILNSDFPIENPPLIVGDRGYAQDNAMRVIAFDVNTGLNLWKFDPGIADKQSQQLPRGVFSHGITYDGGVIFAPTGANGTVVALNATDGKLIWQSASVGDPRLGYREPMPPIVWKDYVISGTALGDEPPFAPAAKGGITAFNRTNGEKIWNISTVTGPWVEGENAKKNGGATIWSGGSFDPQTGIMYLPTGNAAPDFNASSRPPPNPYTSSVIAVDIKNGHILWDTPSVSATDQHDWDTAWGTSLAKVKTDDGNAMKVVIAQNKRGEGFALNADDGKVLWNDTLGVEFRTGAQPTPFGSGEVWPGANYGVEDYDANDNKTAYFAVSNMGFNYFKDAQGGSGHLKPVFDAIDNGIGNGTIVAVDIKTGKVKWEHPTEFPTWVSPAVTNGVVFSGHITATGKPYKFNDFGAPTETPLLPSGVVMAMDKETGKKLWEFNVGAPIGIGGPSIGHGMLFVTTGSPAEIGSNKGGYIIAFGLPNNETGTNVSAQAAKLVNNTSPANSTGTATSEDNNTSTNANSSSHTLSQSSSAASGNTTQGQQTNANAEKLATEKKTSSGNKTKSNN